MGSEMFDLDHFLADCRNAVETNGCHRAVHEIVARAVSNPGNVLAALGKPSRAGITPLYKSESVTIFNVVWGPLMNVPPHDHKMWAVIGVYAGREDNIFWRRIDNENGETIEAAGAKSLSVRDAVPLGRDIIHSVLNPAERLTAAIHVYGGDFVGADRVEWDPETHEERKAKFETTSRYFERSNRLLADE